MFAYSLKKLGFTMIELLIVIAVLGILAVAVLAAINPIEQINRGKDTGSRSDAEQLLSASDRFYASQGYYAWMTGPTDLTHQPHVWATVQSVVDTAPTPVAMLTKLSSGGTSEIKQSFVTRISSATYNTLYMYTRGTQGDSVYVCFKPLSGSFKTEAATRCANAGGVNGVGMPTDIVQAVKDTICTTGSEYICLP